MEAERNAEARKITELVKKKKKNQDFGYSDSVLHLPDAVPPPCHLIQIVTLLNIYYLSANSIILLTPPYPMYQRN